MSWKKHFRVVQPTKEQQPLVPIEQAQQKLGTQHGTASNYSSYLPEVYAGHPNRIQRYYQYDDMDRDSDISTALDTIADFCTQSEEQNENPFMIHYHEEANETEVKLLKGMLTKWVKLNDFKSKLWDMFRNTIKSGDSFFLRDPETGEWLWIDHYSVLMVKVDETRGKEPDEYIVKGLDYNRQAKFATSKVDLSQFNHPQGVASAFAGRAAAGSGSVSSSSFQMPGAHLDQRSNRPGQATQEVNVIDAKHMIHLSLTAGMDVNWPFGQSVLDPIYKVYRQKELIEDAIIIYRVQRAPERRIFYIDVGSMPPVRAKAHIQAIKNEIHQRRIPNRTGGGASIMDASYNPLSMLEDYFFAQSADGRGSKVETLPGGDNLGETGDLDYFTRKLARGLRVPPSYLGIGDEGNVAYNDGKLGQAMIQEYRFNKFCMRLQGRLAPVFDTEFKKFVQDNGIEVDENIFELQFNPPQNFTKYRQIELDAQQAGVYASVADNKRLSERFKFKRFLNLTEEELLENERLWAEENAAKLKKATGSTPAETDADADLSSVGIRPPSDFDLGGGPDEFGDMEGDMGGDGMGQMDGGAGAAGPGGMPPGGGQGGSGGAGGAVPPLG